MEDIIELLQQIQSKGEENSQENVEIYNQIMSQPEIPLHLLTCLLSEPSNKISPLLVAMLSRCQCFNLTSEQIQIILQQLISLYYEVYPTLEISFMLLLEKISLSSGIYSSILVSTILGAISSEDEEVIKRAAVSLPIVIKVEASHSNEDQKYELISTLWEQTASFRENVFESDLLTFVVVHLFKGMLKIPSYFFLLTQRNEEVLTYFSTLIHICSEATNIIDNEFQILLFKYLFKLVNTLCEKSYISSPSQREGFCDAALIPFLSELMELHSSVIEAIPYRAVIQHFLTAVQEAGNSIDISPYFDSLVNICTVAATLDDDEREFCVTDGLSYYDIAFEKTNYSKTPRIISCNFIQYMFMIDPPEVLQQIDPIDCEPKIRFLAEIVANRQMISDELREYVTEFIGESLSSDLESDVLCSVLYLCSKSMWFAEGELSELIFSHAFELLSSNDDLILYLLTCDIVSNVLSSGYLVNGSEERTVEVCSELAELESFSTYIGLRVFSTGYTSFPSLFADHANEYIEHCLGIMQERLDLDEELERDDDSTQLISIIIQMLTPCIQNCFEDINFVPIFEVLQRISDIDHVEEFTRFSYIFNFIAERQIAEGEIVCIQLIDQFLSDSSAFSIACEFVMRFFLIQVNVNPDHFIEFYSDKSEFIGKIISLCMQNIYSSFLSDVEYYFILMFLSRLVQIQLLTGDDADAILQLCVEKMENSQLDAFCSLGGSRISRIGLFEFIASCILQGAEVDLSSCIGKWASLARLGFFATDYERALQVCAMQQYLAANPRSDDVPQAVDNLCLNQNIFDGVTETGFDRVIQIQKTVICLPCHPENFVSTSDEIEEIPPIDLNQISDLENEEEDQSE